MSEKKVYAPDAWVNFGSTGASVPKQRLHNGRFLNESVFVFLALGDLEKSHSVCCYCSFYQAIHLLLSEGDEGAGPLDCSFQSQITELCVTHSKYVLLDSVTTTFSLDIHPYLGYLVEASSVVSDRKLY